MSRTNVLRVSSMTYFYQRERDDFLVQEEKGGKLTCLLEITFLRGPFDNPLQWSKASERCTVLALVG